MKIFIMRHGEAEHFAQSDAQRELTKNGRRASAAVAHACAEKGFSQFDKVLVSPYIRAQQTWQEVANYLSSQQVETCDDITPYGDSEHVAEYVSALIDLHNYQSILLVSHLPLVGYLTAEFVADIHPPMFPTSGLTCIEYSPEKRSGEIVFNMQP
ncbi:phosphohistidine phosphatase [Vibrio galatheae]|uniref:Phosphohistidine phosphatase n=1 Tax=Vibrio galatheae TaxID=579748 RepID=A0A0F4NIV6_9VIBR|nr:phosphohistidine phosphatase SixA [Vibrio galatheae]KJY83065.1 phosphohistidine phosphatase [Vibrio galatheae]